VRVNAVAPGWIASSGMDTYGGAMKAFIPKLKHHVPLRRMGLEAEVSAAIVFLLSPAASFITGVTLPIDGAAPLGSEIFPLGAEAASTWATAPFDGFHRASTPRVLQDPPEVLK
jgi:citronellol/citronellal dehydrogenase